MKLASFLLDGRERIGAVAGDGRIVDFHAADARLAVDMLTLVRRQDELLPLAQSLAQEAAARFRLDPRQVTLLAPLPNPVALRDGYAFRQHVATARRNRGLDMAPEFDRFPVTYFSNHQAVLGPGPVTVLEHHLARLDYELEIAAVIGRPLLNCSLEDADAAIFGFTVMNDWSARALQAEEMKLSLGPCKGKDFATSLGPWLVTPDELDLEATPEGRVLHARMTAEVNGRLLSDGDAGSMNWTFAQILQRSAYGARIAPGEVLGSGTVGTGCLLELNGSGVTHDLWLRPGDQVALEVAGLGRLENSIRLGDPVPLPDSLVARGPRGLGA
jgi:fumarylacetoacetate (FAA) hydrolase